MTAKKAKNLNINNDFFICKSALFRTQLQDFQLLNNMYVNNSRVLIFRNKDYITYTMYTYY
jgi:hypothetical protein